jgi:hypothetical protein
MNKTTPHTRLRIVAFADHEQISTDIIRNFNELLTAECIGNRYWGLKRESAGQNSFCIGGGRMNLPKHQITFDNETCPQEIFEIHETNPPVLEKWLQEADIFLVCLNLDKLPETRQLAALAQNIQKGNKEKTILYAVMNYEQHWQSSEKFDNPADATVALNRDLINCKSATLPEDKKHLLLNGYAFPFTDTQEFATKKEVFTLRKRVFCLGEAGGQKIGYLDCLIYCINCLYKDENAQIAITNNQLYHYLTTNIHIKTYNKMTMERKIKLAVVGASGNGKTHFLCDVLKVLQDLGLGLKDDLLEGYAQATNFWNSQNAFRTIELTNPDKLLTRNEQHYKGLSRDEEFTLEFMDIQGEAFSNAIVISGVYNHLKDCLKARYTYSLFKLLFKKKKNLFFVEEHWTRGNSTVITIRLNSKPDETPKITSQPASAPKDKEESQITEQNTSLEQLNATAKPTRKIYRSGEYLVKHFERYQTESLIDTLKKVVQLEQNDNKSPYKGQFEYTVGSGGKATTTKISDDSRFWKYFYAYVFCETCTDLVICDLLAVPPTPGGVTPTTQTASEGFKNCCDGCNLFLNNGKKVRKYLVFRGMDAMLQEDPTQENLATNILHRLYNTVRNRTIPLAPYIYFLIHLAIYKKYMPIEPDKWSAFENKLLENNHQNSFLSKLKHLPQTDLTILDDIIKDETGFVVPNGEAEDATNYRLQERIRMFFNNYTPLSTIKAEIGDANVIYPHMYFTAYSIDSITLTIHKNQLNSADFGAAFNKDNRLPLGTYNFVINLLFANETKEKLHTKTDMENLLYYYKDKDENK